MRPKLLFYIVTATIIFMSGIAVGQRTAPSKFDKYLRSMNRSEMDFITLEATVNSIHAAMAKTDGISLPTFYFNYKEDRPEAVVFVEPEFEKRSLEDVRSEIVYKYVTASNEMWVLMGNSEFKLLRDNFVLMVYRNTRDEAHKQFAQCKDGNVVFQ